MDKIFGFVVWLFAVVGMLTLCVLLVVCAVAVISDLGNSHGWF